jgi:hypothetical protein
MRELIRTNDSVLLSYLEAVLEDAGVATIVLDGHTSVLEGSAGAIPRRLMVDDEHFAIAQKLLEAIERAAGG